MSGAGKRVVVTGGSGGAGLFIIPELLAHGYTVVNADRQQEPRPGATFVSCDSTVLDQVVNVTAGAYAIVHMAAIASPTPPDQEVWRVNMTGAWNVLEAAEIHGIKKVVMASSVNALGADWGDKITPEYFPIDEDHPTRAQDVYSVSKHLAEELADSYARRRSVQIASLRFHWLMRPEDAEGTYKANLADTGDNIEGKCRGFWSWTGREFSPTSARERARESARERERAAACSASLYELTVRVRVRVRACARV
jgi:nucleoside-diphosphate-sugar epimerase